MGAILFMPEVRGWEMTISYCRMVPNPRLPFGRQTDYSNKEKAFTRRLNFVIKDKLGGQDFLKGRHALVIGPGATPEEARLILKIYPELAKLLMVEWHGPNAVSIVKDLEPELADRTEVYCVDAANMQGIRDGSAHLVYMHSVIEDIVGYDTPAYPKDPKAIPQKIQDIFREIERVLAPGGFLFTLDTKHTQELEDFLGKLGLEVISVIDEVDGKDVEFRDIWRKVL